MSVVERGVVSPGWTAADGSTAARTGGTPYLRLDVGVAVSRFRGLAAAFPGTGIHYAVKANPHPDLLSALAAAGCRFDVASPAEVGACLAAGADPGHLLYSNPVKRRADVAAAAALGVDLFVVDSVPEAEKVADAAPGSAVLCRILTSGVGSDWPLSRKYGCPAEEAVDVLRAAARSSLRVAGASFHVGSQQRDPAAWEAPIAAASWVFDRLRASGLHPWLLDLGGGLPAQLEGEAPPLAAYAAVIRHALDRHFGPSRPATVLEPGRAVAGDAGTVVASVVAVLHRGETRWVYLDAGVFSGLVETLDEAIRYRLDTSASGPVGPCVLAGPTCDSADVLYERTPVLLPLALAEGDLVWIRSAGAYTTCYTTSFNGFAPMPTLISARRAAP